MLNLVGAGAFQQFHHHRLGLAVDRPAVGGGPEIHPSVWGAAQRQRPPPLRGGQFGVAGVGGGLGVGLRPGHPPGVDHAEHRAVGRGRVDQVGQSLPERAPDVGPVHVVDPARGRHRRDPGYGRADLLDHSVGADEHLLAPPAQPALVELPGQAHPAALSFVVGDRSRSGCLGMRPPVDGPARVPQGAPSGVTVVDAPPRRRGRRPTRRLRRGWRGAPRRRSGRDVRACRRGPPSPDCPRGGARRAGCRTGRRRGRRRGRGRRGPRRRPRRGRGRWSR
ncbi:hypothetical protein EKG83_26510 [Saccharothrix syringae]|uniref:Uncharacterized protein n=1 Tax=Saccharothrix syringae TaxID=103733 RepID=A0A5Q0H2K5_SACSY|nr:hypothetical protein EKG83_26510 [Saccharothrix syringae]